jgi:predicted regulator of Ras-like GTPase activity (Roadblock/LC7/MglB family)
MMSEQSPGQGPAGFAQALDSLTCLQGVVGGVVATDDGLPLAARVQTGLDGESLAAAAAAMGHYARGALTDASRGELSVAVLEASRLKLLICPLSLGYLLAITEPEADLTTIMPEVNEAARSLEGTWASLVRPAPDATDL